MKIVIGVNDIERGIDLGEFVSRFKFRNAEYHFVHIYLPLFVPSADCLSGGLLSEIEASNEIELRRTEEKLEAAAARFRIHHSNVTSKVIRGAAVPELLAYSDRIRADLIVVGRREHTALDRLFLGSVSRDLVVGAKASILVVKTPVEKGHGPLGAVLAVDHSEYCNHCVRRLRELAPEGLAHLTLLSVFLEADLARLHYALPDKMRDVEQIVLEKMKAKTAALGQELKGLASTTDVRSEIGSLRKVFRETVERTHSDVLIVGAQGHRWIERLSLGSVSFQQAFEEPYSVLIVRES